MADRHGPSRTGMFQVKIDDIDIPGWLSVNLPASNTKRPPEGSDDAWGETTFQDLEMVRVVDHDDTWIYDWREAIVDGDEADGLKEIVVILMDEEGESEVEWTFEDAWITYYEPPQLDAASDDLATERVSIAYDSMARNDNP